MNKVSWIIIIIIIIGIYTSKKLLSTHEIKKHTNSFELSVTTVSPQYSSISTSLMVTGVIMPREEIVIATELSNVRVKEIYADVGDIVKKGQKLLLLDSESLNNRFIELKSEYERVYDEFDRVNKIKDTGAISKELFIQKLKIMQSYKAKLEEAKLNLERSLVTATDRGIIYERNATIGALTKTNEPLYRIARNNEIEMEAEIPETLISEIKIGQDALITISGIKEPIFGKIRLIKLNIDSLNRTVKVRIGFYSKLFLSIGLFANAEITTNKVSGMVLPATALQEDDFGSYVWKIDKDNNVKKLLTKTKIHNADSIIVENIMPEDKIVARAGSFLKEGDHVNILEVK